MDQSVRVSTYALHNDNGVTVWSVSVACSLPDYVIR